MEVIKKKWVQQWGGWGLDHVGKSISQGGRGKGKDTERKKYEQGGTIREYMFQVYEPTSPPVRSKVANLVRIYSITKKSDRKGGKVGGKLEKTRGKKGG